MSLKKIAHKVISYLPIPIICRLHAIRLRGRLIIGANSFVHGSVHMIGKNNIEIGSNTCISEGCWLNVNHRNECEPAIKIGNNCFIGKDNFFTSGLRITVGDYVLTTIGCKFLGATHLTEDPWKPYISTGTTKEDVIEIGVNCFIGTNAMVMGNIKIGHGSIIGAGSQVMHDIPPFSIGIGNPAKVFKRYSFIKKKWVPPHILSEEDIAVMPNEVEYLSELKKKFLKIPMPFIASGRDMGNF